MANEYILSYTAEEINNKLGKIGTFGDYFDVAGDGILTWDGEIGDRLHMDLSSLGLGDFPAGAAFTVKISDYVPTLDQLNMGISLTVVQEYPSGGSPDITDFACNTFKEFEGFPGVYNNSTLVSVDGNVTSNNPFVSVVTNDVTLPDGTMVEKGIYFVRFDVSALMGAELSGAHMYASSVTFNSFNEFNKRDVLKAEHMSILKKVGSDTIKWDGDFSGRHVFQYDHVNVLCHVSDVVPTLEELKKGGTALIHYQNRDMKIHFTDNMVIDLEEGAENGEGVYLIAYMFLPFALVATKPGAYFNWEVNGEALTITLEKPGVYFPCIPDSVTTKSFMIHDYKGFIKHEVKIDHMPHVDGTIVVETFGTPAQAYDWLNENFLTKKIVRISVTNNSGGTDYGTYEKVTKETGDGSDGYVDWYGDPIKGLSTTYYAFHSIKSGNVNANGTSLEFLRGGLYQYTFYPRKGKMSIGTDGVSWEYDSNDSINKTAISGAGAEDSGFEIAFYCIE